jgi:hypothetical protein
VIPGYHRLSANRPLFLEHSYDLLRTTYATTIHATFQQHSDHAERGTNIHVLSRSFDDSAIPAGWGCIPTERCHLVYIRRRNPSPCSCIWTQLAAHCEQEFPQQDCQRLSQTPRAVDRAPSCRRLGQPKARAPRPRVSCLQERDVGDSCCPSW